MPAGILRPFARFEPQKWFRVFTVYGFWVTLFRGFTGRQRPQYILIVWFLGTSNNKYGDIGPGEIIELEIPRSNSGLGLSLVGNKDRQKMSVFVLGIHDDNTAAKDARIQVGDEILEVKREQSRHGLTLLCGVLSGNFLTGKVWTHLYYMAETA